MSGYSNNHNTEHRVVISALVSFFKKIASIGKKGKWNYHSDYYHLVT